MCRAPPVPTVSDVDDPVDGHVNGTAPCSADPVEPVAPADSRAAATRVSWAAVGVFVLVAYALAWCVALPLWREGGLRSPLLLPLGVLVMATPAIGAGIAVLAVLRHPEPAHALGLVPLQPWRRLLGYSVAGFVGVQVLAGLALLLGAAVGAVTIRVSSATAPTLAFVPVASFLLVVPALGEELGWRGFLLPALRPLGTWPALLVTGVVWGVWHAPLVLIGYNYGSIGGLSLLWMSVTAVLVGVLFGWLRMRSGSVWPSTFAHGALNASSGLLVAALVPFGTPETESTLLGWSGWLLTAVVAAALALSGTFRWASPTPVDR